ncbi:VCBS repeat-containing protein, partial [bacterium]|nr:VCBS repeat-containing protein [bacterium]
PVAAERNGQTVFAGLREDVTLDGNKNPVRADYTLVELNTPAGAASPPPTAAPAPVPSSPGGGPLVPANSPGATTNAAPSSPGAFAAATGATPGAATTVVVYRSDATIDFTITPFGADYSGGARVARGDVTGDGVPDVVVGSGGGIQARVRIWDGATRQLIFDTIPFENFTGSVEVATADFDRDGKADIVVAPGEGGGPRLQVWAGGTRQKMVPDFFGLPYPDFRGGVRVAAGDINRDGVADLVVAPGAGGGPRLTVYDGATMAAGKPRQIVNDFFVFDESVRTGVYLAVGDVDGDGFADVVAGAGAGGAPRVRVVSGAALAAGRSDVALADFFAGDPNQRAGARVATAKLDGDNRADILAGTAFSDVDLIYGESVRLDPDPTPGGVVRVFNGYADAVYVG